MAVLVPACLLKRPQPQDALTVCRRKQMLLCAAEGNRLQLRRFTSEPGAANPAAVEMRPLGATPPCNDATLQDGERRSALGRWQPEHSE